MGEETHTNYEKWFDCKTKREVRRLVTNPSWDSAQGQLEYRMQDIRTSIWSQNTHNGRFKHEGTQYSQSVTEG